MMGGEVPRIIINLKLYRESSGPRAVELARHAEEVSSETGISLGIAPALLDAWRVAEAVEVPVYVQHADPVPAGPHTGHVSPSLLGDYGFSGALLNHSERRMLLADIGRAVRMLEGEGLQSIVCAGGPGEALAAASLGPTAVAFEPPELIGTGVSVSRARPEAVGEAVRLVRGARPDVAVLCGAGVSSGEDVRRAIELGADGVLVASAVAKSSRPREKMMELAAGAAAAVGR